MPGVCSLAVWTRSRSRSAEAVGHRVRSTAQGTTVVVLGHGAGGNAAHAGLLVPWRRRWRPPAGARSSTTSPTRERGRPRPDPPGVLEATRGRWGSTRATAWARARSCTAASRWAGASPRRPSPGARPRTALVFLGYPLHPPGQPEQLRDRHLPRCRRPCCSCRARATPSRAGTCWTAVLARLGDRAHAPPRRGRRPLVQGAASGRAHAGRGRGGDARRGARLAGRARPLSPERPRPRAIIRTAIDAEEDRSMAGNWWPALARASWSRYLDEEEYVRLPRRAPCP